MNNHNNPMKNTDDKNSTTKNLNLKRNIYQDKQDNSASNISINNNKLEYKQVNNQASNNNNLMSNNNNSNNNEKNNFSKLNKLYNKEYNLTSQRTYSKNKK